LDVLIEGLGSEDQDIRWATLLILARLGKTDERVVSLLLNLLQVGSSTHRRMAVYCLRDIGLEDSGSAAALLECFGDPEPLVRVAAVTSLARVSRIDKDGTALLLRLLQGDPDSRVRCSAAFALARLGVPSEEIRSCLLAASQGSDPRLRKAAADALKLIKSKGPDCRPSKVAANGPSVN
jgi:HEAT repeat protein